MSVSKCKHTSVIKQNTIQEQTSPTHFEKAMLAIHKPDNYITEVAMPQL